MANADAQAEARTLTLVKGRHRFLFRYEAGAEAEMGRAILEMARRPGLAFDRFDARILLSRMGNPSE